jgi:cysteine-rich repeat protein
MLPVLTVAHAWRNFCFKINCMLRTPIFTVIAAALLATGCAPEVGGGADAGQDCQGAECIGEVPPGCGDGVLSPDEECDDGNNTDDDACVRCTVAACGDGVVFTGSEQCDDNNTDDGDGCSADCQFEDCGDGEVQPIEQCEGAGPSSCDTSCNTVGSTVCLADNCLFDTCIAPAESCNAVDDDCDAGIDTAACTTSFVRYFSSAKADHMYKPDGTAPLPGYVVESQNFSVYTEQVPGSVALYQKRSPSGGNHLLTLNQGEADQLGYTLESTFGYVIPAATTAWDIGLSGDAIDATTFCRYFHPSPDHLVDVESNAANLAAFGYVKEACFFAGWR